MCSGFGGKRNLTLSRALLGKEDVTTMGQLKKKNISIDVGRCTGCLICQLICSFTYTGAFNPARARIVIERDQKEIHFADECVQNCHLCTRYCVYGAITRKDETSKVGSIASTGG